MKNLTLFCLLFFAQSYASACKKPPVLVTGSTYMTASTCGKIHSSAFLASGSQVIILDATQRSHINGSAFNDLVKIQVIKNTERNSISADAGCIGYFPNTFLN